MVPLPEVKLEPPLAQFAPAGSVAEVTLVPGAPSAPGAPLLPFIPAGPVWLQVIWVAGFTHDFNGAVPILTDTMLPLLRQPVYCKGVGC